MILTMIKRTFTNKFKPDTMYIDKIMWLLAWPAMIVLSYFLVIYGLKFLNKQIVDDPLGEDTNP